MIICRRFIPQQLLLLCLFLYLCPQAEPQTNSPQQSSQTPQHATPKRAPRTLEAFQNAIESGQVGTISGPRTV